MRKKLELSVFVAKMSSEMGRHAELAWWRAFKRNKWNVVPPEERMVGGIKEYKGRRASVENDVDFIAESDGIAYGVEVKNGLSYPNDLFFKFLVAAELGTIPLIIARWLNPAQVRIIKELGGAYIVYKDAIYSTTFSSVVHDIRCILGFPVEARDEIDDEYFNRKILAVHQNVKRTLKERQAALEWFLQRGRSDPRIKRALGTRSK